MEPSILFGVFVICAKNKCSGSGLFEEENASNLLFMRISKGLFCISAAVFVKLLLISCDKEPGILGDMEFMTYLFHNIILKFCISVQKIVVLIAVA